MSNLRPFQIVLLAIFAFLAVIALIFLSLFQAQRSQEEKAYGNKVEIWGTLSSDAFKTELQEVTKSDKAFNVVSYRQFDAATFKDQLVNAIAENRSPDLIVLPSEDLVSLRAKLYAIPYESFSERDFRDAFVDGAEIYARQDGVYGIPFAVDPLLMFWNRDLFASNGLSQAPRTWEEIVSDVVPRLTRRDTSRNVLQSAVAFGEFRNVLHAKETLLLLSLQTGSKMVTEEKDRYVVALNDPIVEGSRAPLEATAQFYTDFSNVNSPLYSWNRALPKDKDAFIAGDLGIYFGLGSEAADIEQKNPNLNFDVSMVPQGANATALRTYGDFYAFAIPKASKNAKGAYAVARILSNAQNGQSLSAKLFMASVRRENLSANEQNPYRKIMLQSALISRAWLDPGTEKSDAVFMQMIEDIVSNRARISEAVSDAVDRLTLAFK
jgi:ABC-type glycerol-3-phosphate transport system substrate-binding protein